MLHSDSEGFIKVCILLMNVCVCNLEQQNKVNTLTLSCVEIFKANRFTKVIFSFAFYHKCSFMATLFIADYPCLSALFYFFFIRPAFNYSKMTRFCRKKACLTLSLLQTSTLLCTLADTHTFHIWTSV